MQETSNSPLYSDDKIDIRELVNILWKGKIIIVFLTGFVSLITVIYSLQLPNIFESRVLLAPVNPSSGISRTLKGYSSLAGIAGVTIPVGIDESNTSKAIKKINSLSFFETNILTNIHLPDLMAVKAWDSKTNTIVFNEDLFDTNSNTWVRDYSYPQKQIPSAQESFKVFTKQHLNLSEDKKSGFITLAIKHQSPYLAKQWVELIVNEINNFYRQKDKLESEKAANYLNKQLSLASLSEVKEILAKLLQEETKKLTLIEANKFYVFEYIDPPAVMEEKSEPKRAFICVLGAIFGGMLSIILVFIRHYFFSTRTS
jgi:LPS O-antigen subunit length determinant protein (WzzB/FepE family)